MARWRCLIWAYGVLAVAGCMQPDATPRVESDGAASPQDGYVRAEDGAHLYYRALGSGADTVIVLHGGPGLTMDYLFADMEPLAAQHFVVFYDQRGTGKSTLVADSASLSGDSFVADLEAVRRHFGIEKLVLFGHSWGSGLAALYARQYPQHVARMLIVGALPLQRSVLLEGFEALAAKRDSTTRRLMQEWREARVANPGDAAACREYYVLWFRPFVADTSVLNQSKGDFCAGTPEALRNKMNSVDRYTIASLGEWDWRRTMRYIEAPTLVIHGTIDPLPLDGAREWVQALPNGRILELNGVGHFPYLETPDMFFSTVDRFLRGEWPAAAKTVSQ